MSLQVWLPLNGDLHNQGLDENIIATNNGATVDTKGKIGKCYSFNGTNNYMSGTYNATAEISFCAWVYFISIKSAHVFDARTSGGVGYQPIYITSSSIQIGNSGSSFPNFSYSWTTGQWYHICVTHNATEGKCYINGILIGTSTAAKGTNNGICNFTLGSRCNHANYSNIKLNDVRIYNHCLSVKEVEELAKGLILHYKLDYNINVLDNCYNQPKFNTSAAGGGWYHWGPSGHAGTYGQNTDKQYIFDKRNTYSHWVDNTASATGKYFLCYQSPAFSGGFRSLQCIVKEANGLPITEDICYPGWNARNGGAPAGVWTKINPLGDGFYLCQVNGLSQDGSNNLVSIGVKPGYKIYISEGYLENNREICSNIFFQNNLNIIYDSSGYQHNGELYRYDTNGTISITNNTPRYLYSTFINSNDNTTNTASGTVYIYGHCELTTPSQMSVAFWCKPIAGYGGNTGQGQFCTTTYAFGNAAAGYDYQNSAMNHRDSAVDINDSASSTQIRPAIVFTANEWHHYAVIYDGQNGIVYKDGVQTSIASFSAPKTLDSFIGVIIGFSRAGSVWRSNKSYYSDFRIYATALTEAQIKELYNTSATIDNNGNIYARELVEI